ncbi:hypothetical protein TNCV_2438981 [Trichonephila clavipes]|nr:hypothetical protein TNCV_2438981 [Trichonephila clavipes]
MNLSRQGGQIASIGLATALKTMQVSQYSLTRSTPNLKDGGGPGPPLLFPLSPNSREDFWFDDYLECLHAA